ncbi:MAG: NUDIX domain-containing protein [Anaerolineae bacterium]|jgi:8-oxo-dGTP pyrophosphatase MutT (NUDIX family)
MPDLFALLPSLRAVGHPLLTNRRVTLVGVSVILYDEEAYYFEIQRPRHWARRSAGTLSIGIGGIGGKLSAGERVSAALRREVEEEIGVALRLNRPDRTALIHKWEVVDWLDLPPSDGPPTPYLVNLLPPMLGGIGKPDHIAIVTFLGRLQGRPHRRDLFGLLRVTQSTLEAFLSRSEWPLEEMLAHSDVALDLKAELPAGCVLRPVLTARALQVLVRQKAHQLGGK